MRKILIIVLTAIMLVSLVACGDLLKQQEAEVKSDIVRVGNSGLFDLTIKEDFGIVRVYYAYENDLTEWAETTNIYYMYSDKNGAPVKSVYKNDKIRVLISYEKYNEGATLTATHIKIIAFENPSLLTLYKI